MMTKKFAILDGAKEEEEEQPRARRITPVIVVDQKSILGRLHTLEQRLFSAYLLIGFEFILIVIALLH